MSILRYKVHATRAGTTQYIAVLQPFRGRMPSPVPDERGHELRKKPTGAVRLDDRKPMLRRSVDLQICASRLLGRSASSTSLVREAELEHHHSAGAPVIRGMSDMVEGAAVRQLDLDAFLAADFEGRIRLTNQAHGARLWSHQLALIWTEVLDDLAARGKRGSLAVRRLMWELMALAPRIRTRQNEHTRPGSATTIDRPRPRRRRSSI